MAKYKVLKKFRDKKTKEVYEENQEIEMSVKRANQAIRNLKKYDGEFLERIDDKELVDEEDNLKEEPVNEEDKLKKEPKGGE